MGPTLKRQPEKTATKKSDGNIMMAKTKALKNFTLTTLPVQ